MWKLVKIEATNLLSFKSLEYTINPNVTTLIFGNNMDADNQSSNGSGKSALLEAISIAITGETLRKVKADEIINDQADIATVKLKFLNDLTGDTFCVDRVLSRKDPQKIQCWTNGEETDQDKQPSVSEYNKYILSRIGLSKEDVFGYFILSKHKYNSFLSSSDKDKKEIINRFSNANIVDESILALQNDIAPVESNLREVELKVSRIEGKISGIEEQIERSIENEKEKESSKESRKAQLNESISNHRKEIRNLQESIEAYDAKITELDAVYEKLVDIEKSNSGASDTYKQICAIFTPLNLSGLTNWSDKIIELEQKIKDIEARFSPISQKVADISKEIKGEEVSLNAMRQLAKELEDDNKIACDELKEDLSKIQGRISFAKDKLQGLEDERLNTYRRLVSLKNSIAGEIECPACKHRFIAGSDVDIQEVKGDIKDTEEELVKLDKSMSDIFTIIKDLKKEQTDKGVLLFDLGNAVQEASRKLADKSSYVNKMIATQQALERERADLEACISRAEHAISNISVNMFDEAFDIVDKYTKKVESDIENSNLRISTLNGAIDTFQNSIADLDKVDDGDIISSLKQTLKEYEKESVQASRDKTKIEAQLTKLKEQEQLFIEFKTHLANSKIEALGHMTNAFLEDIGSDIRIQFSGYTVLKSGKVRDKISISLLRNGLDCGSFDKFSEGEKARVNIANILAMQKLVNVNCEEGKGLDLLVLDEILEATDESGLASIFESLNLLQITSLVVSHGNVAENYPHKLIINKKNDVSFI